MILLDTDHVNILQSRGAHAAMLVGRMSASHDTDFGVTAITLEEQMRGWLALIHRLNNVQKQIPAYERLVDLFDFFARWKIAPFDQDAADEFVRLRTCGFASAPWTSKSPQPPWLMARCFYRRISATLSRCLVCK